MAQVLFRLSISGGDKGKVNQVSPFKRPFTCTQPIPDRFPKLDHLFQTEIKESGFLLQKAASSFGRNDALHELA